MPRLTSTGVARYEYLESQIFRNSDWSANLRCVALNESSMHLPSRSTSRIVHVREEGHHQSKSLGVTSVSWTRKPAELDLSYQKWDGAFRPAAPLRKRLGTRSEASLRLLVDNGRGVLSQSIWYRPLVLRKRSLSNSDDCS